MTAPRMSHTETDPRPAVSVSGSSICSFGSSLRSGGSSTGGCAAAGLWCDGGGRVVVVLLGLLRRGGVERDPVEPVHPHLRPHGRVRRSELELLLELVGRDDEAGRDAGVDAERAGEQRERGGELLAGAAVGLVDEVLDQGELLPRPVGVLVEEPVLPHLGLDRPQAAR